MLDLTQRVLLVDDVVTRGSTLVAAASMLLEQDPEIDVVPFSLARVEQDHLHAISDMLAPAVETINCDQDGGSPFRRRVSD